ncbi:hypothetical protein HPP92_006921 [Vanilla planifolia]|uniref:Uncharacterized protein n=1 Tax=Vanilla planifolia TaxID=51239 RepID=A0A835V8X2_VANPL|nr:hypothetical protein HPP92_006921 [Vanilla planifolia]
MTPRAINSRQALEACTLHFYSWKPFQIHPLPVDPQIFYSFRTKKPCHSDRLNFPPQFADGLDLTRLSLREVPLRPKLREEGVFRWFEAARKRKRRGSRFVSCRSSDWSGKKPKGGCDAMCSDFPLIACGTDSSGELFVNGSWSWASDVCEARVSSKEGREGSGSRLNRKGSAFGLYPGSLDLHGDELGYGSEPGYRGDAESGSGDEFDEEDDDGKH